MRSTRLFLIILALGFLSLPVSRCIGQTPSFKIASDQYQWENGVFKEWSNDMLRIGITTKERGLIFKVTITNDHETEATTIDDLTIHVRVYYGDQSFTKFHEQIRTDYIYLPPKQNHEIFVPVDFGYGDVVGSYKAELAYSLGYLSEEHIDPYPFSFRVVGSEEQLQKEIEQKRGGTVIIIGPFEVKIFDFSVGITIFGLSGILIIYYFWRKRR